MLTGHWRQSGTTELVSVTISILLLLPSKGAQGHAVHNAVSLRNGNTDWPASKAVGMQGASCRNCQDGLQVVCQLLHRDDVTGHLSGNIDQLALLSHQVGAEQCTPRQPAVYASTLAEGLRAVLSCRKGAQAKAKHKDTQSLATG